MIIVVVLLYIDETKIIKEFKKQTFPDCVIMC